MVKNLFKNTKKLTINLFIYLFALIGFTTVVFTLFDKSGSCIDIGGVWDGEFEECRYDCYHWSKEKGCDYIPDNKLEEYINGYCSGEGNGLYRCKHAKLELSKRKLRDKMLKINQEINSDIK